MLKDAKYEIESLFASSWTDTPIHFGGQEFKPHDYGNPDEWINVVVSPLRIKNNSLSKDNTSMFIQLFVITWSTNDVKNMDLTDRVTTFVTDAFDIDAGVVTINDHGWNEANQVYTIVDFIIEFRSGCVLPITKSADTVFDIVRRK